MTFSPINPLAWSLKFPDRPSTTLTVPVPPWPSQYHPDRPSYLGGSANPWLKNKIRWERSIFEFNRIGIFVPIVILEIDEQTYKIQICRFRWNYISDTLNTNLFFS